MPESTWQLICIKEDCELLGIVYDVASIQAECGGCNTLYLKPE